MDQRIACGHELIELGERTGGKAEASAPSALLEDERAFRVSNPACGTFSKASRLPR